MSYINLNQRGLEFKHIITGPAPVGRTLNYVKLVGQGNLNHKNGYRSTNLANNIGSAWNTEFLVGLGLASYDVNSSATDVYRLTLTPNGTRLYELIKDYPQEFNESSNDDDIRGLRHELQNLNPRIISVFEDIFRESVVFQNLRIYLDNNGYSINRTRNQFYDDYFETFKIFYEGGEYDRTSRTTTGANRVPSLIQLCIFFNYFSINNNILVFNLTRFSDLSDDQIRHVSETELEQFIEEENNSINLARSLEERYGIDGNILVTGITRNSNIQRIFRENLFIEFEGCCAVTGKNTPELLIASHIKGSADSNVHEKIDHNNGLLLSANFDKLFDQHLISFNFISGEIMINHKINEKYEDYDIDLDFVLEEKFLTESRRNYLMEHNIEFEQKNRAEY